MGSELMATYKVIERKTKSFLRGRMTAAELKQLLNQYGNEGWSLDRIVAGPAGEKDVFQVMFKREQEE